MYQYLADTNEPYDEALDWAILFHDIVYDEKSEKELRSAEVFVDMIHRYEGCTPDIWERDRVSQLILRTVDHTVTSVQGASAIIRADLHGLTKRLTSFENFGKIMKESMALYGIDEVEFCKNTEKFMTDLMFRVHSNIELDPNHTDFYLKVGEGIHLTITLARMIRGNT
jgi:predicted metal-dependent HD superfamily phosphohydrolase